MFSPTPASSFQTPTSRWRPCEKERAGFMERGVRSERKRYLCVGHLGRALPPKAQQDGENRERVSETEKWAENRQIERERKGIGPISTLLPDRSVKFFQLWCIWGVSATEVKDTLCPNSNWLIVWRNLLASTLKYTRCQLSLVHCIYPVWAALWKRLEGGYHA